MASLEELEKTAVVAQSPTKLGSRIPIEVKPPTKEMFYDEWRKEIHENFPELTDSAEACASVMAQLLIRDVFHPFCLILVGPAASGKTITLNFFSTTKELVEQLDGFTNAAFVSNIAGRTEAQLKKIDLLPRVRYRVLSVTELNSITSVSEDALREKLGMMTKVLDGQGYTLGSGVHGVRGYTGDYLFMMLAASTPFDLRVWKAMAGKGHRLFFYEIGSEDPNIDELLAQLQRPSYRWHEQRCQIASDSFIRTLWTKHKDGIEWDRNKDDVDALKRIVNLAKFCRCFRGEIIVYRERFDHGGESTTTQPAIEQSMRINQCLYNFARGNAVLKGRNYIKMEDTMILIDIIKSTAPKPRPEMLRCLVAYKGKIEAAHVMTALGVSRNTAKNEMKKLAGLGIGDMEGYDENDDETFCAQQTVTLELKKEFMWLVNV